MTHGDQEKSFEARGAKAGGWIRRVDVLERCGHCVASRERAASQSSDICLLLTVPPHAIQAGREACWRGPWMPVFQSLEKRGEGPEVELEEYMAHVRPVIDLPSL